MAHEIILHHYSTSPFSEKVRLAFGIKKLAWRSVESPTCMPKPDLLPLTGGYRKIPVMQIGADIFCDTQIILRELERRFPEPIDLSASRTASLMAWGSGPTGRSSCRAWAWYSARSATWCRKSSSKDRAKMSGSAFSTEAMRAAAPFCQRSMARACGDFIAETTGRRSRFRAGAKPGAATSTAIMNLWWLKRSVPQVAELISKEFPEDGSMVSRASNAIGHGKPTPMEPKEALAIAKAATSEAKEADDPFDPRGCKPGRQSEGRSRRLWPRSHRRRDRVHQRP